MKNKIFFILLTIVFSTIFISCSGEEEVIDNYSNNVSFLLSDSNQLRQYSFFTNEFSQITPDYGINRVISNIRYFRGNYYLVVPADFAIYVIKERTYELLAKIDYKPLNIVPIDICFPNATDAFVCHDKSNDITIIDLTNFSIASTKIPIGKNSFAIAALGNQVYVCNTNNDMVSIIDTRTLRVEDSIKVHSNPKFIDFANDSTVYVVSIGNGKDGQENGDKTPAMITIIDVVNRKIKSAIRLGSTDEVSKTIIPTGLAITPKSAYVSSNSNLWRVALVSAKSATTVAKISCKMVHYNSKRDEIYLIENRSSNLYLNIYNTSNNTKTHFILIPNNINAVINE